MFCVKLFLRLIGIYKMILGLIVSRMMGARWRVISTFSRVNEGVKLLMW